MLLSQQVEYDEVFKTKHFIYKQISVNYKNLINEIDYQLNSKQMNKENSHYLINQKTKSIKSTSVYKISNEEPIMIPSILTTAKFASNKPPQKHLPDLRKYPYKQDDKQSYYVEQEQNSFIDTQNQFTRFEKVPNIVTQQDLMQSLNLSVISNSRKPNNQSYKLDTSLNFSQIRQSVNIPNSFKHDQSMNDQNDVSVSFQDRLDHHVQEIDDDLSILAKVFYDRQIKLKVFKGLILNEDSAQNTRLLLNFSLCNYDNQSRLCTESTRKIQQINNDPNEENIKLSIADEFYQTIGKIKVFSYLKGLALSKQSRQQMKSKLSTLKRQGLNSSRANTSRNTSKTLRRIEDINLPLKR